MTSSPRKRAELGEGSWDDLFDFLDPSRTGKEGADRDGEAEARYAEISSKLVCYFAGRGRGDAEDLASTTILRVAARCRGTDVSGHGDPAGYFFGVARHVLQEAVHASRREAMIGDALGGRQLLTPLPEPDAWRDPETVHRCLDECMAKLTPRARRLLLSYYSAEGGEKIEGHRLLAESFGKSLNALRIELHRVRKALRRCVFAGLHVAPGRADAGDRTAGGGGRRSEKKAGNVFADLVI